MNKLDRYTCVIELEKQINELDLEKLSSEDISVLRKLVDRVDTSINNEELRSLYFYTREQIEAILNNQKNNG